MSGCSDGLKNDLNRFRKRVCKMVPSQYYDQVQSNQQIFDKKCINLCDKILDDKNHPLHVYLNRLSHHSNLLNMIYCRTKRFKCTFIPSAIAVYNEIEK